MERHTGQTHFCRQLGAAAALLWLCCAVPVQGQDEKFRERQILDPEVDEFVDRPADPATVQGELEQARSLLATGESGKALRLLKRWTKDNSGHERHLEGMYLLGEAYFETGDFFRAYESYDVVIQGTGGDLFFKALRRNMDVSRAFLSGQKRILWRIFRIPAYDDGLKILDRVWEQVPGTRMGEESLKLKADYYYANGDLDLAQDTYSMIVKEYPNGRYTRAAMLRGAEAADAAFPGVKFDDKALVEADERYSQLQDAFPDYAKRENVAEKRAGIREKRAQKDLEIGGWYQKTGQGGAAEYYYRLVLKDYAGSLAASEARGRLRTLGVELSETVADTQPASSRTGSEP